MRGGLLLMQSFACTSQIKFLLVATEIRIHFKGTEHTNHNLQLAESKSQIGSISGPGYLFECCLHSVLLLMCHNLSNQLS